MPKESFVKYSRCVILCLSALFLLLVPTTAVYVIKNADGKILAETNGWASLFGGESSINMGFLNFCVVLIMLAAAGAIALGVLGILGVFFDRRAILAAHGFVCFVAFAYLLSVILVMVEFFGFDDVARITYYKEEELWISTFAYIFVPFVCITLAFEGTLLARVSSYVYDNGLGQWLDKVAAAIQAKKQLAAENPKPKKEPKAKSPTARTASQATASPEEVANAIAEYRKMLDDGLISQEDFNALKAKTLSKL